MFALQRLPVIVFAVALVACSSGRPAKSVRVGQGADFSRRVPVHAEESSAAIQANSYGTLGKGGARSFEAVAETTAGSRTDTYGTSVSERPEEPLAAFAPPPASPAGPPGKEGNQGVPGSTTQPEPNGPTVADVTPGQMLVYTASLTMAVYQVDQGLARVEQIARENDGYLATRGDLAIAIRVPRAKFEAALKAVEGSGDVVHREIKAEDVTDSYFDMEVRARNARAMRDRLAKLLQQASVKDALEIEKELARVTQELELLEGKLKLLRHRVAFSTINVSFRPRGVAIQTRPTRLPFPWLEELGLRNLMQLEEGR
jgi:hypothetical protein